MSITPSHSLSKSAKFKAMKRCSPLKSSASRRQRSYSTGSFETSTRAESADGAPPHTADYFSSQKWNAILSVPTLCTFTLTCCCARCRFSASPATGLVGMQENGFLSDFFGCVGFLPLTTRRCRSEYCWCPYPYHGLVTVLLPNSFSCLCAEGRTPPFLCSPQGASTRANDTKVSTAASFLTVKQGVERERTNKKDAAP